MAVSAACGAAARFSEKSAQLKTSPLPTMGIDGTQSSCDSATWSMYSQFALREYRASRERPCTKMAAILPSNDADQDCPRPASVCAMGVSSFQPVRILNVTLPGKLPSAASTTDCIFPVFVISAAPMPWLQMRSIGHPMLMSTKSTAQYFVSSSPRCAIFSGLLHATWTPKHFSSEWRRSRAHSEAWPCRRLSATAISPQVMSAPYFVRIRRKGRLPTVVSGATYTFPRKSTSLRSRSAGVPAHAAALSGTAASAAASAAMAAATPASGSAARPNGGSGQ
mmetsp:Transcript_3909/g.14327  ORF Transcript_3909/g.14327 Transcript_3909/m.14327 type:complete len:280 (+) Transcript_3909:475-1314(+)